MSQKLILKFFYVYIILIAIITTYLLVNYKNNKEQYLNQKTEQHKLQYKAIYDKNRMFADLIFDTYINNKEIINIFKDANSQELENKKIIRDKLFSKLKSSYEKLKLYNVKQLHFHLPNNESFLRMHRPDKFGDNLLDARESVAYVNKNRKKYDGFEEGRIFNGFRFVYPLFNEDTHIGSVEISFNVLSLIESIYNTYNLNSSFLINKNVVDKKVFEEEKKNYISTPNKKFYYEKSVHDKYPPMSIDKNSKDMSEKIMLGAAFSTYIEKINLTKTFIPIKNNLTNKVVAAICICSEDRYIKNSKNSLILTLIRHMFY